MNAIQAVGLTKKYKGVTAVDGLDLSIRSGELFSLLGVNGAGKTTTIKMLSCLTQPTSGDALLGGMSIKKDPAAVKRIIGVSPQETAVAPNLTVRENLELMCGVRGYRVGRSIRRRCGSPCGRAVSAADERIIKTDTLGVRFLFAPVAGYAVWSLGAVLAADAAVAAAEIARCDVLARGQAAVLFGFFAHGYPPNTQSIIP